MNFEFNSAGRIIFGPGSIKRLPELAKEFGNNVFLIKGHRQNKVIEDSLTSTGLQVTHFNVEEEPSTQTIFDALELARPAGCNVVIGLGGGSVLDTGKAVSALLTNKGDLFDYLEVIGLGAKLKAHTIPYIAIPTTAGTGAEVTKNAVISSPEHRVKVSMRHPYMLPNIAMVDPELTLTMPPDVTASTGLDALTQLIEAFVTLNSNPLTDGICREGLLRASRSLLTAFQHGDNYNAREDMALAGLFSGLALANAGLGAVHGIAGPLGGFFNAPHGVVCARLLPFVMEKNVNELVNRNAIKSLARFDEIARIITGSPRAIALDGVAWVKDLCEKLSVTPLAQFGMTSEDIPVIVEQALKSSSMKGNPVELDPESLAIILQKCL